MATIHLIQQSKGGVGKSMLAAIWAGQSVTVGGPLTIQNNTAGGNGGAIYTENGDVTISNSLNLTNNTAKASGGAIYAAAGNVTIPNGIVLTNNNATGDGGGIWAGQSVTASGPLTIQNNTAGGNGGAIHMAGDGADLTLSPTGITVISNNVAGGNGGSLYSNGNVTITTNGGDVTLSNNTAGGLGGAIYIDPDVLTLNAASGNITFTGNTQLGGQANAISIDDADGVGGPARVFFHTNDGNITFFDPIANNLTSGPIAITKDGPGMVSFDGSNFAATDYPNLTSAVFANTMVNAGTFEVANNAIYGAYDGTDPVSGLPLATSPEVVWMPVSLPNYRMEAPVYMVAPALAERMGRDMLGTYHDRVGEDHPGDPHGNVSDGNTVAPDVAERDKLGWFRVFGEFGHVGFNKGASNFSAQGPSYDFGIDGIQAGFDAVRRTRDSGTRDISGLYAGYMHGHADVNQVYSSSRAGTVDMSRVWLRHIKQQDYYPAKASRWRQFGGYSC